MWVLDPQNTEIVFLGSKTHFFISDTYIFHSELICYVILHPQNWFQVKKWVFDSQNTKIVFLGSKTHFFTSDTYFFFSESISNVIWHLLWRKKYTF